MVDRLQWPVAVGIVLPISSRAPHYSKCAAGIGCSLVLQKRNAEYWIRSAFIQVRVPCICSGVWSRANPSDPAFQILIVLVMNKCTKRTLCCASLRLFCVRKRKAVAVPALRLAAVAHCKP